MNNIQSFSNSIIIIIVIIVIQVEGLLDSPVTEFNEKHHASTIPVTLSPLSDWITHVYVPPLQHRNRLHKLIITNSAVIIGIDSVESNPIFIVLAQVFQQEAVFSFCDVIIAILCFSWNLSFCSRESS